MSRDTAADQSAYRSSGTVLPAGVKEKTLPAPKPDLPASMHAAIGALSGLVEVSLLHPTVAMKNALQCGRPLPTTFSALYRGYALNASSFVPITCLQFGVNRWLERQLQSGEDPLSASKSLCCSAAAGVVSSALSTPSELVIIQQQRTCAPLLSTAAQLARERGLLLFTRGWLPCALREGCYVAGYLGTAPLACGLLMGSSLLQERPAGALVLGGVLSGCAAAVLTQPLDTVKTRMQARLDDPAYSSMTRGLGALWREGGSKTLWRGLLPRGGRIVAACVLLSQTKKLAVEWLDDRRDQ